MFLQGRTAFLSLGLAALGFLGSKETLAEHPLGTLPPGHWYEAPSSALTPVLADPAAAKIVGAWGGGALDTKRNLMVIWGGGHADYWGNEVYAFDINGLSWSRLDEPSCGVSTCPKEVPDYPDGRPTSRHTYNNLQYIPAVDRFMSFGIGAAWGTGNFGGPQTDAYDLDTRRWSRKTPNPTNASSTSGLTAYDSKTGRVWVNRRNGLKTLAVYDPSTDTWEGPYGNYTPPLGMTAAIDPGRQIMVAIGQNGVRVWDLTRPGNPTAVESANSAFLETVKSPGFEFDPTINKFVAWTGGASVFVLDPDTWAWTTIEPAAGSAVVPPAQVTNGTFGRFRYVPKYDAYVLVNGVKQNVYFYKLNKAADFTPPPNVSIQSSTAVIGSGGSVTINWNVLYAEKCEAQGAWTGPRPLAGSQVVEQIAASSTFALSCTGKTGKTGVGSVTVTVDDGQPQVNLSTLNPTVVSGANATLVWSSAHVDSCVASGDWSGDRAAEGSAQVGPISANQAYTLTCTGAVGSATSSTSVSVTAVEPEIHVDASPTTVDPGDPVTVSWNSKGASNCVASGDWYGPRGSTGSETTQPLSADATFELTCDGPEGDLMAAAKVNVKGVRKDSTGAESANSFFGGGATNPAGAAALAMLAAVAVARRVRVLRGGQA